MKLSLLEAGFGGHLAPLRTSPRLPRRQCQQCGGDLHFKPPVIVVSANDSEDARKMALALGASFFLRKPVDDQALIDAINWVTEATASSQRR